MLQIDHNIIIAERLSARQLILQYATSAIGSPLYVYLYIYICGNS